MLLRMILFRVPTVAPGASRRLPRRRKRGVLVILRIVMPVKTMSSSEPPSTHSSENPRHVSKTQFEIDIFLNPPAELVPHLILPVGMPFSPPSSSFFHVPSSMVPSS